MVRGGEGRVCEKGASQRAESSTTVRGQFSKSTTENSRRINMLFKNIEVNTKRNHSICKRG